MKKRAWLLVALGLSSAPVAGEIERPSALDGSQYAVIAPVYDGSGGALSFLRLFNGGTATSAFTVTVIDTSGGVVLGTVRIAVPKNASPQFPLVPAGGNNSIFDQIGMPNVAGRTYALYIQDQDPFTGYQHVTYNASTTLFENNSVCSVPLNQQLAPSKRQVLTNVHTTALADGNYPSVIAIHNHGTTSTLINIAVYDAATGSSLGQFNQGILGNLSIVLPESEIERQINFRPTSSQSHINLVLTGGLDTALPVEITQSIHNGRLGGEINMGEACAAPVATSVAAAYCGTAQVPGDSSLGPIYFSASVAVDGTLKGAYYGQGNSSSVGGWLSGTVLGTSLIAQTSAGSAVFGTVNNGSLSGSINGQSTTATFSATTGGCSQ